MPKITRQLPPAVVTHEPVPTPAALNGDILGSGTPAANLVTSKLNVALYGRNGCGKTTLACQGEGPIALLAIDPAPTGGARSVSRPDVIVYYIAAQHLVDEKTGNRETVKGSEKVLAIVDAIKNRTAATGKCPFRKVVVDGLNSWFEVILSEVLGLEYASMPAILSKGKVTTDQYVERSERLIKYLRPVMSLPCDVWLLAQEKDHNPPRDEKDRVKGSKLMREVLDTSAQAGSFYSFAISDEACRWVQNASDFVMQLYDDAELKEERLPDVVFNGQTIPGQVQLVATGRRVKRLRCTYHPNYAARFREDYRNVPEYIEAPNPEERYQAFLDVVSGQRTKWGHYLNEES